jgi:hypothetical protein
MLILAAGDSVRSQTGYGRVSQHVFAHFLRRGHKIIQIGWQHSEPPEHVMISDKTGMIGIVDMFPPHTFDTFSTMSTITHFNAYKPQMVYYSNDVFTCSPLLRAQKLLQAPLFLANYGVLDADGAGELFRDVLERVNCPVTPSKFGFEQLKKVNPKGLYIPHGVDLDIYHPMQN